MSNTLIDIFIDRFNLEGCTCTLREASWDSTNQRFLSDSNNVVINFDKVKERYCKNLTNRTESMASVDAIFVSNGRIYFVEFKSNVSKHEKIRIKRKVSDSILLFLDVVEDRLSRFRNQAEFILVYGNNTDKIVVSKEVDYAPDYPGFDQFQSAMGDLAKKPIIKYDMQPLQGVHFATVHTLNETEFKIFLTKHTIEELSLN